MYEQLGQTDRAAEARDRAAQMRNNQSAALPIAEAPV